MPTRAALRCLHPGCRETVTRYGYCPQHGQTTIHLVIGPPCSGKTTYVREHARVGDLVVDWDALMAALSGRAGHVSDPGLSAYIAAARDAVVTRLTQRRGGTEPPAAWIVATTMQHLGMPAQVHVLDVPAEECIARLHADPDGRDVAEVEQVIRSWQSGYRP